MDTVSVDQRRAEYESELPKMLVIDEDSSESASTLSMPVKMRPTKTRITIREMGRTALILQRHMIGGQILFLVCFYTCLVCFYTCIHVRSNTEIIRWGESSKK